METSTLTQGSIQGPGALGTNVRGGLRDRNVKGLFELMDRRTELRGVHPVADHLVETVTWAV